MYRKRYHIHFVGIGGIGMSGIAELLINLGYRVSGSDLVDSDICRRLAALGGRIEQGHRAENVAGADVVVVSSAIGAENPEVAAARRAGTPVIPRAEMLAELMRLKYSVAVAGAHGKTTTTAIVAAVLGAGGLDPTVVIGGKLGGLGANAVLGRGEFIVAEADESDGSFLRYAPTIAVVTNIDREHLDYFADLADIQRTFTAFLERIPFYGLAVLCLDSEPLQDILPAVKRRVTTYGFSAQADLQARDVDFVGLTSRFAVWHHDRCLGRVTLNLPGAHNVSNALASLAVGLELDLPFDSMGQALQRLTGVQRRMEVKGRAGRITVVDDYGHHPTEIRATLRALDECWPGRRMVAVFQPHRYTRTRALHEEFARAFHRCDRLLVLPIYAASETPLEGVTSEHLVAAIQARGHKQAAAVTRDAVVARLVETLHDGDLVLTLGAGDVWQVGEELLRQLAIR